VDPLRDGFAGCGTATSGSDFDAFEDFFEIFVDRVDVFRTVDIAEDDETVLIDFDPVWTPLVDVVTVFLTFVRVSDFFIHKTS
jgi:hypothetical protein